jgi:hypothetical protein
MPSHPALQSEVLLQRIFFASRPETMGYTAIATVGEALRFLIHLPAEMDGGHWRLASNGLLWAHNQPEKWSKFAAEAFENALLTDDIWEGELIVG